MNPWRASFRCLTFGAAFLLAACASEKAQISPEAASGLTQVRAQAVQIKQQLSRTTDRRGRFPRARVPSCLARSMPYRLISTAWTRL